MTPHQIELVQKSWMKVLLEQETAAILFYEKLFELDPALRALFKDDIKSQGRKLIAMIGLAVSSLGRLDSFVPALQALGRGHVKYGVDDSHYDTMGVALIWALEQVLGESFTADVRAAWIETYELLASVMRKAVAT